MKKKYLWTATAIFKEVDVSFCNLFISKVLKKRQRYVQVP